MKKREIKDKSVTFVIPIICVVVLNLIFSLINHGGICVTLKNMIAEILFIYAIFVVLMILSKSSFISNVVTIIGYSGLFLVNQLKIYTAGEPLYISDFHLASDVADISKLVDYNDYRIIIFLCGISFFVLAMLTVSYITRIKLKTRKNQFFIIMSIISITILTLVISPSQSLRGFYKSFLYEINTRNLNGAPLNNIQYYIKYGMLSGMYGNWLENIIEEPESYNISHLLN